MDEAAFAAWETPSDREGAVSLSAVIESIADTVSLSASTLPIAGDTSSPFRSVSVSEIEASDSGSSTLFLKSAIPSISPTVGSGSSLSISLIVSAIADDEVGSSLRSDKAEAESV